MRHVRQPTPTAANQRPSHNPSQDSPRHPEGPDVCSFGANSTHQPTALFPPHYQLSLPMVPVPSSPTFAVRLSMSAGLRCTACRTRARSPASAATCSSVQPPISRLPKKDMFTVATVYQLAVLAVLLVPAGSLLGPAQAGAFVGLCAFPGRWRPQVSPGLLLHYFK